MNVLVNLASTEVTIPNKVGLLTEPVNFELATHITIVDTIDILIVIIKDKEARILKVSIEMAVVVDIVE